MRVLEAAFHGGTRMFSERPYGYKRYIVEYPDGETRTYSALWYRKDDIIKEVEERIDRRAKEI